MSESTSLIQLLEDLSSLSAVSGMEQAVVAAIYKKLKPFSDEIIIDDFGNLIAIRHGAKPGPRLMLAAHSDEVGGIVTCITKSGFLKFQLVGVINPAILPSMRVRIAGKILGTIGSIPGHLAVEDTVPKVKQPKELFIDVGAIDEVEVRSWGIQEGSSVSFESPLVQLGNPNLVMGKAIDNRIGCAVLISLFETLWHEKFPGTLYGVINVQEEIGMHGASMTTARIQPDYAIALDTIPTDDTPNALQSNNLFSIGSGPVIQLWEGKRELFIGTVAHHAVTKIILDSAKNLGMKVQISAEYGSWVTDGAVIHKSGLGIPTGFVSIPRRYAHTPNEILDIRDVTDAIDLLLYLIREQTVEYNPSFIQID